MLKVSYPPQSGGHVQHHPFARGSGSYKLCQSVSGQYVVAYIAYILPNLPAAVRVDGLTKEVRYTRRPALLNCGIKRWS